MAPSLVTSAQKLCPSSLAFKLSLALNQRMIKFVMLVNWVGMFVFPLVHHNPEPLINSIGYIVIFEPAVTIVSSYKYYLVIFYDFSLMFGSFCFGLSLALFVALLNFVCLCARIQCDNGCEFNHTLPRMFSPRVQSSTCCVPAPLNKTVKHSTPFARSTTFCSNM
jgi:hypothetical protein